MPWNVTSFASGEIWDAGKINGLQENFTAITKAHSGAPQFTSSAYTASLMTESKLWNSAYRNNLMFDLLDM